MMWSKRWLVIYAILLGVPGLLVAGVQAAQAATLGKTTIGASNGGGLAANAKRVNEYQLNVPAAVSKLDIYLSPSGPAGSQAMEGVIYADAGGAPGALVAQSRQISFSSTSPAGWYDLPLASNVTLSPGKYWLGIYTGGASAVGSYRYDLGASTRARLANNQTYVKGGASNPFGTIAWSDKNVMSLYATYRTPAWVSQSLPAPAASGGQVAGVSCASGTACIAVGDLGDPSNQGGTAKTLAERWNGTSWSLLSSPNPTGATKSVLDAVSCSSPTLCTAVGWSGTDSNAGTLAERWNGTSWSVQTTPNPTGAVFRDLNSVSCPSATSCIAVGYYYIYGVADVAFAERWNGTSWSIQTTPKPAGATNSALNGVSCSSATACIAVGSFYSNSSGRNSTLAERWNGTSWSIQTTPNPTGSTNNALNGVSCTSATACIAVGYFNSSSAGLRLSLAERWNGTSWSIQTTPNPIGSTDNGLNGVSCTAVTVCSAVGYFTHNSSGLSSTLAERSNGASWWIQPTPSPLPQQNALLDAVSCPSTTDCAAVGRYDSMGFALLPLLAERYW